MKRKVLLSNEVAADLIEELLKRADEGFSEKEIRLYVFGASTEEVSWSGVHGVVGRILPEYATTHQGVRAFPNRKYRGSKWIYDKGVGKYMRLTTCPTCGK